MAENNNGKKTTKSSSSTKKSTSTKKKSSATTSQKVAKTVKKETKKAVKKAVKKIPVPVIILIVLLIVALLVAAVYFDIIPLSLILGSPSDNSSTDTSTSKTIDPTEGDNSSTDTSTSQTIDPTEGDYSVDTITSADLSIHFLELGNKNTGDCVLIKVGNTEVLIDAGSKTNSVPTLKSYIDKYCTDNILEYVIVTHAHEDHYAGFSVTGASGSMFDFYECQNIITFAKTTSGKTDSTMYKNFMSELNAEVANGAVWKTADQVAGEKYDLGGGVELEILDSYFYYNVSSTENNHSVCAMINQGTGENQKHFLFTGDLEKEGEEKLVEMNSLPEVVLYKAGHHGSKTSSHNVLLNVIKPQVVCVCCCAGSPEYTSTNANMFPTQDFVDRIAPFTKYVYVTTLCVDYSANEYTSMNGNIAVCSTLGAEGVSVFCENNSTLLKDTEWFKANRTVPAAWAE